MTKRRRRRAPRASFNAAGWADRVDLILGLGAVAGVLALFLLPR